MFNGYLLELILGDIEFFQISKLYVNPLLEDISVDIKGTLNFLKT